MTVNERMAELEKCLRKSPEIPVEDIAQVLTMNYGEEDLRRLIQTIAFCEGMRNLNLTDGDGRFKRANGR